MNDTTIDAPAHVQPPLRVGIWLDHRIARLVELRGDDAKYSEIRSGIESNHRATGGVRMPGKSFVKSFAASEKKRTRQRAEHLRRFYSEIIETLPRADSLVLLGPGRAKGELAKVIREDQTLTSKLADVRTAEKMSERQLVAAVRNFFH